MVKLRVRRLSLTGASGKEPAKSRAVDALLDTELNLVFDVTSSVRFFPRASPILLPNQEAFKSAFDKTK